MLPWEPFQARSNMSPTATIATVVIALVFFAWLFQSDIKDPGYEEWVRKQREAKKDEPTQRAGMNIAVTDPNVTKEERTLGSRDKERRPYDPTASTAMPEIIEGVLAGFPTN